MSAPSHEWPGDTDKSPSRAEERASMGLSLDVTAFQGISHEDLFRFLTNYYRTPRVGRITQSSEGACVIHETTAGWTVTDLDELRFHRHGHYALSRQFHCVGIRAFVYDGDYWGYELFQDGYALDHFVQGDGEQSVEEMGLSWFPGWRCSGDAASVADVFPHLSPSDVAPYFVPHPLFYAPEDEAEITENDPKVGVTIYNRFRPRFDAINVPPRPSDEFTRFDECALLNFLRLLGIQVILRDRHVTFLGPITQRFDIRSRVDEG